MPSLDVQARPAIENLLQSDPEQLYAQLGLRTRMLRTQPGTAASFEPQVTYEGTDMGAMDELRSFGQRVFRRWSAEAHQLLCGTDSESAKDRDDLKKALGMGEAGFGAILAGVLVSQFGLSLSVAAVIAALVVKVFFRPVYEEMCATWKTALGA